MPDVLVINPGGRPRVIVNASAPTPSEVIVTENNGQSQVFVSPAGSNVFLSPNPIIVNGSDPQEVTALMEQVAALQAAVTILQAEQAMDIIHRMQYTPSSPSSTWIITHNFGYVPSIELYINGSEAFTDTQADATTATLTFPSPMTGVAILT